MKPIFPYSADKLATKPLPGPSSIIRIADEPGLLPEIYDKTNAKQVQDFVFWDQSEGERAPTAADARQILTALRTASAENLVVQCQAGIGRSVAVCMAWSRIHGEHWENRQAYNRTLYRLLLEAAGVAPEREPLVSIALRVKYSTEHLMAFLLSLRRQRYDNWEAVAFTDGPRHDVRQLLEAMPDSKTVLLETAEPRGLWGHPYRQAAFDLCRGEWIGTNNDDNYLTPAYIEQLVTAGEQSGAKLVLCSGVHRYSGWGVCWAGQDLACWLARRELIEQVKWTETDFLADQKYLNRLMETAGPHVAEVPRALVVKN
jgi:hypothetical protein